MVRVTRVGGRIIIEGLSWDYIGARFPQLDHMGSTGRLRVRLHLLYKLTRNEILFKYSPLIKTDVAAFVNPAYTDPDADAVHFALVQETYKFLEANGCMVLHVADHMDYAHNISHFTKICRKMVYVFKPIISRTPIIKWFVSLFPLVAVKCRQSE